MRKIIPILLIVTVILSACSGEAVTTPPAKTTAIGPNVTPIPTNDPALLPTPSPSWSGNGELTRKDQQGAVIVEVTPVNLDTTAESLQFSVVMNTHSVDLSMDLATLSTLTTDTGAVVRATLWDAPLGGHHVSGTLIFPALKDGKSILEGASKLILTIVDVDAPVRVFEWELK